VWRYSPRITAVVWALFVTILVLYYAALTWMPTILHKQGYGDYAAFAGTTLMTGVGIVGVLVSAWLCDKYGRKWVIGASGIAAAIALVLFALTLDTRVSALIWLAVFGFLIQLTIPVLYAYGSELYPTRLRASGFGWASAVSRFTTALGPWLFGTLLWPAFGLPVTFAIVGVAVCAAVVWMTVAAPETKGCDLDAPIPTEAVTVPNPAQA
jgi:putative MFS transporter